jgi:hypothetical protein
VLARRSRCRSIEVGAPPSSGSPPVGLRTDSRLAYLPLARDCDGPRLRHRRRRSLKALEAAAGVDLERVGRTGCVKSGRTELAAINRETMHLNPKDTPLTLEHAACSQQTSERRRPGASSRVRAGRRSPRRSWPTATSTVRRPPKESSVSGRPSNKVRRTSALISGVDYAGLPSSATNWRATTARRRPRSVAGVVDWPLQRRRHDLFLRPVQDRGAQRLPPALALPPQRSSGDTRQVSGPPRRITLGMARSSPRGESRRSRRN